MAESKQDRIGRLLAEGLDHYGVGDVAQAILAWEEVLVLDPGNGDAQDYIKTADRRKRPRPPKNGTGSPAIRSIAEESCRLIAEGGFDEALDLLHTAAEAQPESLELQAQLDVVRARLLQRYRSEMADPEAIVRMVGSGSDITRFNLPSDAGFLLSRIDGETSVADLISLSGMDDFEALRLLHGLRVSGLVELGR